MSVRLTITTAQYQGVECASGLFKKFTVTFCTELKTAIKVRAPVANRVEEREED